MFRSMREQIADRRRAWRYPVILEVAVGNHIAISRDVSASGIYFETDAWLAPGQTFSFAFTLERVYPDVRLDLECAGTIVRVERRKGRFGVAATIDSWSFEPRDTRPDIRRSNRDRVHASTLR
jgi:PilZ domain-containing protein